MTNFDLLCYNLRKKYEGEPMLLFYISLLQDHDYDDKLIKIYNEYKSWMLKIAFHFLKNEEDAKDVVHDTFIKITGNIQNLPVENPEVTKSYLFIAIKNSSLNMIKSKNRKNKVFSLDDQFDVVSNDDIEENASNKSLYDQVLSFIDTLPDIYKQVLTMHLVCSISLKEISNTLNIPFKTIETRYIRGLKIVREKFKGVEV